MKTRGWGFDVAELDRGVRPQDDFFQFVNGGWIKKNTIPPTESHWGSFGILRHDTEKRVRKIVEESRVPLIRNFYRSGMDLARRNMLGAKPLAPLLAKIEDIKSRDDLLSVFAYLETVGGTVPWRMIVDQDMKDAAHYITYFDQSGLGMPDRDYYLKNTPEEKRVRDAYRRHIAALMRLMGASAQEAVRTVEVVMRIETALAHASMDKVSIRDPHKVYHKKTVPELARLARQVDWRRYLALTGAKMASRVIVSQPKFLAAAARMTRTVPLSDWKTYLTFHTVNGCGSLLSKEFVKEQFAFYGKVLVGNKKLKPLWRRVLSVVNGSLGEAVGREYVRRHFTPAAKRKMDTLVSELFVAYRDRIRALDWMSPETKRKALGKLAAVSRKIGYPSRWRSYRTLKVRPDDYFGNVLRTGLFEHHRAMCKIGKPVEKHEWHMSPQTVNAYYSPTLNEIVFPAAILQPPFFDPDADDAVNYGAIGSTIGHEMTHGFDDQGAKFDAAGNLRTWWAKNDKAHFDRKGTALVRQFDRYQVVPGISVNGKLTLGENIADLGGAAIAFDAYERHLKKTGRKDIDGLTPEQRFFLGWARAERDHARPEYLKMIVAVDSHSPASFRVNGPVSNLGAFYEVFSVKPGHKLYRAPSERVKIW